MSDSDDSDFDKLEQRAKKKHQLRHLNDDVEEASTDDSTKLNAKDNALCPSSGRKKRGTNSVSGQVARLDSLRRKNLERRKSREHASPDTSDEEAKSDSILSPKRARGAENGKYTISILDDSSDDDELAAKPPVSIPDLQRQGANCESLAELHRARHAIFALQQAQQYHAEDLAGPELNLAFHLNPRVINPLHPLSVLNGIGMASSVPNSAAAMLLNMYAAANTISMLVIVSVTRLGSNNAIRRDVNVQIKLTDTVEVLQDILIQQMQLTRHSTIITVRCNGHPLIANQQLTSLGLRNGAVLEATAILTDFEHMVPAVPKADPGQPINLLLRSMEGKKVITQPIQTTSKTTFKELVDKYRSAMNIPSSAKILLKFDGESLEASQTPHQLDMEDEDLLDVIVR